MSKTKRAQEKRDRREQAGPGTFEVWLAQEDKREQLALMPPLLQVAFAELFKFAALASQDAYAAHGETAYDNNKVQMSTEQSRPMRITNEHLAGYLEKVLVEELRDLRTELAKAIKVEGYEPRKGPRRRGQRQR